MCTRLNCSRSSGASAPSASLNRGENNQERGPGAWTQSSISGAANFLLVVQISLFSFVSCPLPQDRVLLSCYVVQIGLKLTATPCPSSFSQLLGL